MEQMKESTQIVQTLAELRFNLCLIAEAIVAEESGILDWVNHIFNIVFPGSLQLLTKGIAKGKFDPNDFLQYGKSMLERYDTFWSSTTDQRMPKKFELREERARNTPQEPLMRLLQTFCRNMNDDLRKHCACAQFPCDCILP